MRTLVWFRADLRTRDNPALHAAAQEGTEGVVGVFVVNPEEWHAHDWAPVKVDFLLRTLRELSASLGALGVPLRILHIDRQHELPAALLALAKACRCGALCFNAQHEVNEQRRDARVSRAFIDAGLAVRERHDQTVIPPDALRTGEGGFYTVFTPFKRAWIAALESQGGAPTPLAAPRKQPPCGIEPDPVPDGVKGFRYDVDPALWPAGERAAQRALAGFVESRIAKYHQLRDRADLEGTSALSPHLAIGAISARQCLHAAIAANRGRPDAPKDKPTGASTWISELIWREFYRHVLVGFPRVCMHRALKRGAERVRWRSDPVAFRAWAEGRTGYPIVDAAQRQLLTTGWMHNRLRMISAMFLTKHLLIDWREGERHFMSHLIDGDLANNNGGWQWSASVGADAAPYFRIFNPTSQSRKADPQGAFIRRFVPELRAVAGDEIHEPSLLPPLARASLDYPPPIVEHGAARARALAAFGANKNGDA